MPLGPRRLAALYGARLVLRLAAQRQPSQGRRRAHDRQKRLPSKIQASAQTSLDVCVFVCVCECVFACSVANARHGCVEWRERQPHQSAVVYGLVFLLATLGPKRALGATMRGLALLVVTRARAILGAGGLRERYWRRAGGGMRGREHRSARSGTILQQTLLAPLCVHGGFLAPQRQRGN